MNSFTTKPLIILYFHLQIYFPWYNITGTTKRLRHRANFASLINVSIDTTSVPTISFNFFGLLSLGDWDRGKGSGDELLLVEGVLKLFFFRTLFPFDETSSAEPLEGVFSDFEPLGNFSCCKIGILFGYCSLIRPLLLSII